MYNYIKVGERGASKMIKVGIVGATGYVGQQLTWLLYHHPKCEISFLTSNQYSKMNFSKIYGQYKGFINKKCIKIQEIDDYLDQTDVVFLALPHGKAFALVKKCLAKGIKVIDIGADFRLKDPEIYEKWYQVKHDAVDFISQAVYGLPEIHREEIKEADFIANPGCYCTASILALIPLLKAGVMDPSSIIIDAASGVSGSGRSANTENLFTEVHESFKAYKVASHRHTPEIEQELSAASYDKKKIKITFTPHLAPMNRGILATCYGNLENKQSIEELYELYYKEYGEEYFIRILEDLPETRWVKGSNFCDIALRIDERTNRIIVISAIDNMGKGAAGQGIQNLNILFGLKEQEGLEMLAMMP